MRAHAAHAVIEQENYLETFARDPQGY